MAGKRGNSEGSIRKRIREGEERWEARYVDGGGKRRSVYAKTRQEVARKLANALRDREQGIMLLNDRQTVGSYLTSWLQSYKQRRKYTSYDRYERMVRVHLIPGLGTVVLSRLTAQMLEVFYSRQLGQGSTPATVRNCHMILGVALSDAERLGLVRQNVVRKAKQPRAVRREMAVYDEEQVRILLGTARGTRQEALAVLALATGMRQGELLALKWRDVDLDRATLLVRTNLIWMPEGYVFEETKTAHSRRRIALPKTAVEALRRHRERQAVERARLGAAWTDLDLVFANAVGRPYYAGSLRVEWWRALVKRAKLPYIRFHDLRHTAATLLLSRGVNVKVISEMLGHSSVAITLSVYSHVLPHMQQQAADTMDAVLAP